METYVSYRQNTVSQFIRTRAIMNLCLSAERLPMARVSRAIMDLCLSAERLQVTRVSKRLWELEGM